MEIMLIIVSLLLVTMALSAVMLFVLSSLRKSGARGISEWSVANAMAVVSMPLFAARGAVADFLSIEVANTLLLSTTALMLAGFRRYLHLPVPWWRLGGWVALGLFLILLLHHGVDSTGGRIVAMSLLHAVLCLEMGMLLKPQLGRAKRHYPVLFTLYASFGTAAMQLVRAAVYAVPLAGFPVPWNDTAVSMIFFSIGALALPALTLGAVMMANATWSRAPATPPTTTT